MTIGPVEGEPESMLFQISTAALFPDGRVAVADQGGSIIRVFRPDGTFERQIGRKGEGPGEFQAIRRLAIRSSDTIVAYDRGLFRLSTFLASGRLISTVQIQADDGPPELFLGEYSTGELGFAWISHARSNFSRGTADVMKIGRFSGAGRLLAELGSETGIVRWESSPLAFSPQFQAGMMGDSLVLTNGLRPELQVWDPEGGLVRTIGVPVPEVDPVGAWEALDREIAERGKRWQQQWLEGQPNDQVIPRISEMWVDHRGRIWIKPYEPRTDSHLIRPRCLGGTWLIMDGGGLVLAKLILPDGFEMLDAREGRVLERTVDELGVERLRVYDVVGGSLTLETDHAEGSTVREFDADRLELGGAR